MGEDLIENEIYVAKLFGSDLQGNDLYKLEPLKQIGNATFVKATSEFKKGDILISTVDPDITVIFDKMTSITAFDSIYHNMGSRHYWSLKRFRHATEKEKQKFFDELKTQGKRWNAEKLEIEDIPQPRFKNGDKVRIKRGVNTGAFMCDGLTLTVDKYHDQYPNTLYCKGLPYLFHENWLEPYVEELKKGDLAIFWDNDYLNPLIRLYDTKRRNKHYDNIGTGWDNAVKWDGTKEQFEKILRGEI